MLSTISGDMMQSLAATSSANSVVAPVRAQHPADVVAKPAKPISGAVGVALLERKYCPLRHGRLVVVVAVVVVVVVLVVVVVVIVVAVVIVVVVVVVIVVVIVVAVVVVRVVVVHTLHHTGHDRHRWDTTSPLKRASVCLLTTGASKHLDATRAAALQEFTSQRLDMVLSLETYLRNEEEKADVKTTLLHRHSMVVSTLFSTWLSKCTAACSVHHAGYYFKDQPWIAPVCHIGDVLLPS